MSIADAAAPGAEIRARRPGFDFNDLFILDLANNHQGSRDHAVRIIREMGAVAKANGVRAVLKFQFRDLDTFIHPAHRAGSANKHVSRFLSTRLAREDWAVLAGEVRAAGMVTMATPFDEPSVDLCQELGMDVIKVASCSATDWPLLEKISEGVKPVVFSTGGLTMKQIDDLASFFAHRRVLHAMEHCVSIYPTPDALEQLNQIEVLRRRYPDTTVGFSTHEPPDELVCVAIAVAKGARMFERHVGIETETIKLNAYSSTPAQVDRWMKAALKARTLCGGLEKPPATAEEESSLDSLRRGVYARKALKKGSTLRRDDVYFAMPRAEGQLHAGEFREGAEAVEEIPKDGPLTASSVKSSQDMAKQVLFTAIHTMKGMLNEARVPLPTDFRAEFSHHRGMQNFDTVGCTLIDIVNRAYGKKLVIQTPGQYHPSHYHKKKEETFHVLWGVLEVEVEGRRRTLYPGDMQVIQQGVWHEFWTETGAIFEELSTTAFTDDSFYEDKEINAMPRSARKTIVNHWGRYQI
ncbi:MAG: N-acetylneuraminate synthase family protein [Candidatus Brocadiae bacterium]|nr:N-acetylneuraminate synthase family protein [Candidatus Brocadiia bacterium]